jgi:xanthine dehydrogenase accessory factor
MNRSLAIWPFIEQSLAQHIPVMLLYVLDSQGSSPGRQGFGMALNALGAMVGSVGGGIMEHKFVEMAREKLRAATEAALVRRQVHHKAAAKDQSGMICSGEQTLLLYRLKSADLAAIRELVACLAAGRPGLLQLSPAGLRFSPGAVPAPDYDFTFASDRDWQYRERMGCRQHLHLVGGGHCALALSRLMQDLDFCIHLYEDRPALNTFLANDYVKEKQVVSSYEDLAGLIPGGDDHYVVIMTFGYRTDDLALRALMPKSFRFLGVLGSRSKIKKMFDDYRREGMAPERLSQVYAPVGLAINSRTPEEIAVSIAAQLIGIKNQAQDLRQQVAAGRGNRKH